MVIATPAQKNLFWNCCEIRSGVTIVTTEQARLASLIPCLDAGGGMILRAIGSWLEGSSSLSGSLLPSSETNSVLDAETALGRASGAPMGVRPKQLPALVLANLPMRVIGLKGIFGTGKLDGSRCRAADSPRPASDHSPHQGCKGVVLCLCRLSGRPESRVQECDHTNQPKDRLDLRKAATRLLSGVD